MSVLVSGSSHSHMYVRPYDVAVLSYSAERSVIYWTDSRRNVIAASRQDASDIGVVVADTSPQFKPRHLAVDACLGSVTHCRLTVYFPVFLVTNRRDSMVKVMEFHLV